MDLHTPQSQKLPGVLVCELRDREVVELVARVIITRFGGNRKTHTKVRLALRSTVKGLYLCQRQVCDKFANIWVRGVVGELADTDEKIKYRSILRLTRG